MNKKNILLIALLSVLLSSLSFAASGKIRGRVVDDKTKEPLIGANIVLLGTNYGAVTDIDGNYIILNVPPSTYSVKASFISYQNVTVNNVKVNEDLTSEVNFNMMSSEVQLGEVIITQDRPLVNKNATNAVRIGTQEDIQKLPVRGVTAAVVLSPGIVQQNGNLYIRGGRADEVGYFLEGASTRSVTNGTNLTTVIPEALEEFQVQAGGYNAEFGGANAGIIRQTLRSGSSDYKVSLQLETDNFTPQNTKRLGTYSYGYSNYVLTLGGPIINNVKFFMAGENEFQRDNQKRFWEGFTMYNLPNSQQDGFDPDDDTVEVLDIKQGNISGVQNRFTFNGTVSFDYNPYMFRLGGAFTYQRNQGTADPIGNVFNYGRLAVNRTSNLLLNGKFTHILGDDVTSYEINVNYGDNRTLNTDPDHGENFFNYSDSIANYKYGYQYRSYTQDPLSYELYGFTFSKYGELQAGFNKGRQIRLGGAFDITSQVDKIHQIKIGASVESYNVSFYSTGAANLLFWMRTNPDILRTPGSQRDVNYAKASGVNNYGYDWYGNKIDDTGNIDGPKTPTFVGAYIQDKIEYSDLVVNAGIRFDYIDNDDIEFVDDPTTPNVVEGPKNPSVDITHDQSYPIYKETGIANAKPYLGVSPRLGFSFPVSDKTVFHLQYGKFLQSPQLNIVYRGRAGQAVIFGGQNFIPNPVGYNIQPTRTTQYEVGFTQQFSENAAFDITGFYKDIQGQIQIARVVVDAISTASSYNAYVNGDFVTTKGVEVSLRLRRVNRIRAQIGYTFSDAQGTGSTIGGAVSSLENGTQYPSVISPLDFNQTHRGTVNIDYSWNKGDGGPILEGVGINLLFTFNSGHPFTKSTGSIGQQDASTGALVENDARNSKPIESINESTTPWQSNLDLRLTKAVNLFGLNTEFYIYVQNLMNTRNVLNVYRRTGNSFDDGYLGNPDLSRGAVENLGSGYVELYENANLKNGRHYRNTTGNELWGTPRQLRFGLKMEI